MKYLRLLLIALSAVLASCGTTDTLSSYEKFSTRSDYRDTYETFTNKEALDSADRNKTSVHVSVKNQRLQLRQNGIVLVDTPCTTGRSGKRTPYGTLNYTTDKLINALTSTAHSSKTAAEYVADTATKNATVSHMTNM